MSTRRTVRDFSDAPIPNDIIENAIRTAGTAPSGAHRQPWHFVVVQNAGTKLEIREAAEAEERKFYRHRAGDEWLDALAPLGTDANKPFLETAPILIAIFLKKFSSDEHGKKHKNYYTYESVGIATGLLIAALHNAGIATLTHTPSPMKFLNTILNRSSDERAFLLLVCGYPAEGVKVPDLQRKPLNEISDWV
ncbi:MAG: nitroreductase family protein [Pseudomonadota bacterium]